MQVFHARKHDEALDWASSCRGIPSGESGQLLTLLAALVPCSSIRS
jgi:hypothetical protein